MKTTLFIFGTAAALAIVGCEKGTPGGPGATNSPDKTPARAENTFTLNVPTMAVSLKQGETKMTSISVKRMRNFDEDVTVKFGDMPKGVTLDPVNAMIKHGENEAKLTIKATDDAALGDFTVDVTGTPTSGTVATNKIKISVSKK
jgi:uncharacterized membrane protein